MKKLNDNLSEIFDIAPIDIKETPAPSLPVIIETGDVVEDDANYARENLRALIDAGTKSVTELSSIANASEQPRAYEVLSGLMKNLADMNKDLLALQKAKRELAPQSSQPQGGVNIDKAVFVGSTSDLVKFIKSNK